MIHLLVKKIVRNKHRDCSGSHATMEWWLHILRHPSLLYLSFCDLYRQISFKLHNSLSLDHISGHMTPGWRSGKSEEDIDYSSLVHCLFYYVMLQISNSFMLCIFYQCQDDTVLVSVNCTIKQFNAETLPALKWHNDYIDHMIPNEGSNRSTWISVYIILY